MTTPLDLSSLLADPVPESPGGRALRAAANEFAEVARQPDDSTVEWLRARADTADRADLESADTRAMIAEPLGVVGQVTVRFDVEKGHEPGSYDEPGYFYLALRRGQLISHDLFRHADWLAEEVTDGDVDPDGALFDAIRRIREVPATTTAVSE